MSQTSHGLPYYNTKPSTFRKEISFSKVAWVTVLCPFASFIFCVLWSIMYNFEEATYTHCNVKNYLPSISAAIGSFSPQKYVWKLAICIHFVPRLMISRMYREYYSKVLQLQARYLVNTACMLNVIENFALLGLTLVSSSQNYGKITSTLKYFVIRG